VIVPISTHKLL